MSATPRTFHDEQPFEHRRIAAALAVLPALVTGLAVLRLSFPARLARLPASAGDLVFFATLLWIVFAWLLRVRLVVDVDARGLRVGLRGLLWSERLPVRGWTAASIVSFDAPHEFGGYGLRRVGRLRAYIARGTTGVKLALTSGDTLVVGTPRPAELLAALDRASKS